MPEYMEGYGAGDERRSLWLKRVLFIGIPAVFLAIGAFFYLRTWTQERTIARFIDTLEQKQYDEAYAMWCNAEHPCRYYPIEKFQEDWGTSGIYGDPAQLKFGAIDYCGSGVVFESNYANERPFGLWVERSTNMISFAPYQRCPGKHFQFRALFKRFLG